MIADGQGWVLCDSEEELENLFYSCVGDDGPTHLNCYNGRVRIYALTCDPRANSVTRTPEGGTRHRSAGGAGLREPRRRAPCSPPPPGESPAPTDAKRGRRKETPVGDMADYTNDPSGWHDVALYDYGGMLQCRNCGECGLHWAQEWNSKKWRLFDRKSVMHKCPVKPLPEGDR